MELLAVTAAAALLVYRNRNKTSQHPYVSTSHLITKSIITSAPGKVLITGGYQVLEKPRQGIVIAGDARFHTTAQWRDYDNSSITKLPGHQCYVLVRSSQFSSVTLYEITASFATNSLCCAHSIPFRDGAIGCGITSPPSHNPYVHTTLVYTFTALMANMHYMKNRLCEFQQLSNNGYLEIVLNADNCFYSQQQAFAERGLPPMAASYAALEPFARPTAVSKTGLGSSATLVSSLVGALMTSVAQHVLPTIDDSLETLVDMKPTINMAHVLAQVCHVVAQGKVGSGFDVCAAVYGSICYERYTPALLSKFLNNENGVESPTARDLINILNDKQWDHVAMPFGLPEGLEMMLGDIAQGSSTPSMVRKVKTWRTNKESQVLWDELNKTNNSILENFDFMRDDDSIDGLRISQLFLKAREQLKEMGKAAGVDIEPNEQTELCNATMLLKNVLACGVPGAGGNDAVFVIYQGGEKTRNDIEMFWYEWRKDKKIQLCAMPLRGTPHGKPGLRIEV